MNDTDHRQVIAELDALLARIAGLLGRFEVLGQTEAQRDDYLALHELQARVMLQREAHWRALAAPLSTDAAAPLASNDDLLH